MKFRVLLLLLAMTMLTMPVSAQKGKSFNLWPQGAPNTNYDGTDTGKVTVFLPEKKKASGRCVVICPGGGYSHLAIDHEGFDWAPFFNSQGIAVVVLKYRMPRGFTEVHISDAEEAVKMVRRNAKNWNIDPKQVGIMGFSAGGHLTMMSYTHNHTAYKPHFLCPMYPVVTFSDERYVHRRSRRGALGVWGQWCPAMRDSLSIEQHITPDGPPVFLVNCVDDPIVRYQNSELLDSALTANEVPHRYIQYRTGGHGFGASESKGTEESRQWKKEFLQWISSLNQ